MVTHGDINGTCDGGFSEEVTLKSSGFDRPRSPVLTSTYPPLTIHLTPELRHMVETSIKGLTKWDRIFQKNPPSVTLRAIGRVFMQSDGHNYHH